MFFLNGIKNIYQRIKIGIAEKNGNIQTSGGQVSLFLFFGFIISLGSVDNVFAAKMEKIAMPNYKLFILPIHKYIYVNTMNIVKYRGISPVLLEKRYPGLDLNIIKDLRTAGLQQHPSLLLNATLFKGRRNALDINILQIMTTSKTFPNTVELKYDAKNIPWFRQRIRTFQFLITREAAQVGRLKTKPYERYPVDLYYEAGDFLWKNGFRGESRAVNFTNKNPEAKEIGDETGEEVNETPHLANICANVSEDIKELGYDLRENGIVVVKNIVIGSQEND